MAAKDFTDPRGWGARHKVVTSTKKKYGDPPRVRMPGDSIPETFFICDPIRGDDLHVWVHRKGNPNERAKADTPKTTPPEIHFTLAETFQGKDPISTRYDAKMVVFMGSPRKVKGSYARTIGGFAPLTTADETGTWTGNNPPPGSGGPGFQPEERLDLKEHEEPRMRQKGVPEDQERK